MKILPLILAAAIALVTPFSAKAQTLVADCRPPNGEQDASFAMTFHQSGAKKIDVSEVRGYSIPDGFTFDVVNVVALSPINAADGTQQKRPFAVYTSRVGRDGNSYLFYSIWSYSVQGSEYARIRNRDCPNCGPEIVGHWENRSATEPISDPRFSCAVRQASAEADR